MTATGRDVSFDSNRLWQSFEGVGLDSTKIAGLEVNPKTLKNWKKTGRGYRTELEKFVGIINNAATKRGYFNLVLPAGFLKPVQNSVRMADAVETVVKLHADCVAAAQLLVSARQARDATTRASFLNDAVSRAKSAFTATGDDFAYVIASQALRLLAAQAATLGLRAQYYAESVSIVSSVGSCEAACEFAQAVIDVASDQTSGISPSEVVRWIAQAKVVTGKSISERRQSLTLEDEADLLGRRSALFRTERRTHRLEGKLYNLRLASARRCIDLANSLWPSRSLSLESTLVQWAEAETLPSGEAYTIQLKRVDEMLMPLTEGNSHDAALLAAVHFHRSNFSPFLACRFFEKLQAVTENVISVYQNVDVYAEAALLLTYDVSCRESQKHLENAEKWTAAALKGGFRTARNLVNYMRLLARRDQKADALAVLSDAFKNSHQGESFDVAAAVRQATIDAKKDPVSEAFAIGIADPRVLCSLGTAILEISNNESMARILYELALEMKPNSAVAHTNLARWFLRCQPPDWEKQCRMHLLDASAAPRQFIWWRSLLHELKAQLEPSDPSKLSQQYSLNIDDIGRCQRTGDLHKLLLPHGSLVTDDPLACLEVVLRLATLRYCIEVDEWKTPGKLKSIRLRFYDRTVILVGSDARTLTASQGDAIEKAARQRKYFWALFDLADTQVPTDVKTKRSKRSAKDDMRLSCLTLTRQDIIVLLTETTTLDRLLYVKTEHRSLLM